MSKEERRFPELRFKGFNDDWEQRKLGKDISAIGGATPSKSNPGYWNGPIEWLSSQEIKKRYISEGTHTITKKAVDEKKTRIVEAGTPLIVSRSGILSRLFPISIPVKDVAINQDIKALVFNKEQINTYFLVSQLRKKENYILKSIVKSGTTVQSVNMPDFLKLQLSFTIYDEQEKIGCYFAKLDDAIELHQRKTTILNKIKKIYFEKLFSIDKKLLPKLRFKYYDKLWELRKLENLIEESGSGGTPKSTNSEYYNGNIPFLSISDISKSNGYINSTEKYITETGLRNSAAWIVPKGAVSLAMYASVGKVAILNIDATTSQAFYNMVFDNDNLRDFVYHRLNKANELNEWVRLISTGTQSNLNAKKVKNFEITLPANNEEISKISSILNNLETNINLNKRKVKLLLKIKQAYLKKVFI